MVDLNDLQTPALLIDLPRLERNISTMQAHCNELGFSLRPHFSAHNILEIAHMQIEAGAVGVTCNTVQEAEACAEAGISDILIAHNVVGEQTARQLLDLTLYNRIVVTADHPMVVATLADVARDYDMPLRIMVELATHLERGGVQPDEVVELARRIEHDEFLHFAGVMLYPSGTQEMPALREALDHLHKANLGVDCVSGGGTGVIREGQQQIDVTEFRAGRYILNDWMSVTRKWADMDDCALLVAATVIGRPSADIALLDCGYRTLGALTAEGGYGFIMEYADAYIFGLSQHMAQVDLSKCRERPVIGERIHLIPVDSGMTLHLQHHVHVIVDGQIDRTWRPLNSFINS